MPVRDPRDVSRRTTVIRGGAYSRRIRNEVLRRSDERLERSLQLLINSVGLQLETIRRLDLEDT